MYIARRACVFIGQISMHSSECSAMKTFFLVMDAKFMVLCRIYLGGSFRPHDANGNRKMTSWK